MRADRIVIVRGMNGGRHRALRRRSSGAVGACFSLVAREKLMRDCVIVMLRAIDAAPTLDASAPDDRSSLSIEGAP